MCKLSSVGLGFKVKLCSSVVFRTCQNKAFLNTCAIAYETKINFDSANISTTLSRSFQTSDAELKQPSAFWEDSCPAGLLGVHDNTRRTETVSGNVAASKLPLSRICIVAYRQSFGEKL
jgi:hypothetical protein